MALVKASGVTVSQFSYRTGNTAYLEEDCDAPRFIRAYYGAQQYRPEIPDGPHWEEAPMRAYLPYWA